MPYLLQRIAIGMLLLGFAMVPGLLVVRFGGLLAAVLVVAGVMAGLGMKFARRVKVSGVSFTSFVTSKCDMGWHLHPAITFAVGSVFLAVGVWVLTMPPDGPALAEQQMTELELHWLGMIALFLGVGVSMTALAYWMAQHEPTTVERPPDSVD